MAEDVTDEGAVFVFSGDAMVVVITEDVSAVSFHEVLVIGDAMVVRAGGIVVVKGASCFSLHRGRCLIKSSLRDRIDWQWMQ